VAPLTVFAERATGNLGLILINNQYLEAGSVKKQVQFSPGYLSEPRLKDK
jgi:hypothetical protein